MSKSRKNKFVKAMNKLSSTDCDIMALFFILILPIMVILAAARKSKIK